ncbi:MAG: aromatic acid exporter family protein [Actinomycetota bacterium]|nr:aromatic acid exporter family protein [Actinomycetota bacterium]
MFSLRRVTSSALDRIRERLPGTLTRALRLTGAAVASYLVALGFVAETRPVTAALTALLIVQVTLVGTIADTARRIVAVVLGVGVAIGFSSFVGFTWWSLAAIVAASILLGQALRLGPHLMEVPISAMLILAVGGAGVLAVDRVVETLVGASVGLLVNVLFPPAVQGRSAGAAVEGFAEQMARLLDRVAKSLIRHTADQNEVRGWLDEARSITNDIGRVDQVLTDAGRSRQLNPRAAGTEDTTPDLRSGLASLEHSAVALRAVFRSIADRFELAVEAPHVDSRDEFQEDLREAFATVMSDLAQAVRDFGALVRAEVDEAGGPHTAELARALDAVREARVRLTELLLVDPQESPGLWQLHGSLLAGLQRVLAELDVEERIRQRERRREQARSVRRPAAQAAERLRSTTRRVVTERPPLATRRKDQP